MKTFGGFEEIIILNAIITAASFLNRVTCRAAKQKKMPPTLSSR